MTFMSASDLPQADASTLVDRQELERRVQEIYRSVAREPHAAALRDGPRALPSGSGILEDVLAAVPESALASFAGVGYHLDLAAFTPATACQSRLWARGPTCSARPARSATPAASSASTSPTPR